MLQGDVDIAANVDIAALIVLKCLKMNSCFFLDNVHFNIKCDIFEIFWI